ncbi:putative nucleotide-diphospho-sugar transferase [Herbivorax sp. ANBcel31]|uniref:hypothetical protein n=1 Tax=Herbivorax sp. ANBcel31 TaxID=3069754 RepID=UPI0027B37751|nr:hypothetical protein [Herbivorax sp. ANBcel31]MDQ2087560.1 putative nucleotide-diphospho-sugar transferase [Herbivorax sp. ANBcel31]
MHKFHFTTIVSKSHLYKFTAMYTSLSMHCDRFKLYVLCADEIVYKILKTMRFEHVKLIKMREIENKRLLKAKKNRNFYAYCWTLKPCFLYHVMMNYHKARYFAHLDADLCFFDNPRRIFSENKNASLFLTHHRNSEDFLQFYDLTGIYNTGFVGCKNDDIAKKAVRQWKNKCIKYCPMKEDTIKKAFGDQRYVEDWPVNFPGVHIVKTAGANAAFWNISNYKVTLQNKKVFIDEHPLIFYHFSGLVMVDSTVYSICLNYSIDDENVVNYIYVPYLKMLKSCIDKVKRKFPNFNEGFLKREYLPDANFYVLKSKENDE